MTGEHSRLETGGQQVTLDEVVKRLEAVEREVRRYREIEEYKAEKTLSVIRELDGEPSAERSGKN